ncbi:hypothetical protein JCM31598_23040 [Desulfonatronum parangueonense]
MARRSTTHFETQHARLKIQVVMNDNKIFRTKPVPADKRTHGVSASIHESQRLESKPSLSFKIAAPKFAVGDRGTDVSPEGIF